MKNLVASVILALATISVGAAQGSTQVDPLVARGRA
jgi:hypothetical protein